MDKSTKVFSASIAITFSCLCFSFYYLNNKIEDYFNSNNPDFYSLESKLNDIETKLSYMEDSLSSAKNTETDNNLEQAKEINDLRQLILILHNNEKEIRSDIKDIKSILRIF